MNHTDDEWIKAAAHFGWHNPQATLLTNGLINHTWKIETASDTFILQHINTNIFKHPEFIDENLHQIGLYIKEHASNYLFTHPIKSLAGNSLIKVGTHFYRAFNFLPETFTITAVQTPSQAFEAAQQFAKFTAILSDFPVADLKITLPHFHDLSLRFQQFKNALAENNTDRLIKAEETIKALINQEPIVKWYVNFIHHPDVHKRVTHHDTKISNVLFNKAGEGVCVIDLDTVMAGYFFSDAGDMFRTYLSPVSEETAELDQIFVRKDIMLSIEKGYLNTLKSIFSSYEIDNFYLSGEILLFMQALRFMTDYLQHDIYYGSKYAEQNLIRAKNQLRLLQLYQQAIH